MTREQLIDWLLKHGFNQSLGADITDDEQLVYTKGYPETGLVTFTLWKHKLHLEGRDGDSYATHFTYLKNVAVNDNTNELKGVAGLTRRVKSIIYDNHEAE